MQRWNGSSAWDSSVPTGQTFSNTTPVRTVTVPGLTQFSWWSGGNASGAPLPVDLLYFKGHALNNHCMLEWATSQEVNCDVFTLERSKDGLHYELIKTIEGSGSTLQKVTYLCTDSVPAEGLNYYRLKQKDFDGKWNHLSTTLIHFTPDFKFILYPNPSNGKEPEIRIDIRNDEAILIEICDYLGKVQNSEFISPAEVKNGVLKIPHFNSLPDGIYFIRIQTGTKSITQKIIKN